MKEAGAVRVAAAGSDSATPWLAGVPQLRSVEALRQDLRRRHKAFAQKLKEIAILGAAEEGVRLVELCRRHGVEIRAILDDSPARQGTTVGGLVVIPVAGATELPRDLPIVIASHRVLKAAERLRRLGFEHVAPFALLQVLDPVSFPPHMFYEGWLEDLVQNREQYLTLADRLADDFSRQVLDAVLGYRLTLDATVLSPVVEWELYGPAKLLTYGNDEVYVDAGAYDGDSIRLFIERVHGSFSKVIAFEPDTNTFRRLAANFADDDRVQPINAGLHRRRATLHFDNAGTRGSVLIDSGGVEIKVVGLDEVVQGERVTFVKMNIEGAELEALRGARATIERWGPKLAISAYHRPSDLWQVPALVRELRSDYRLYLRQHDGGVIETVLYGLI